MKIYTIIGGVNGVGKSSFTGVLKERSTDLGMIVDVDKITAELGGNALAVLYRAGQHRGELVTHRQPGAAWRA